MSSKKLHIQLYADECFPFTSATHLKSLGYSIIHAYSKKLVGKSDLTHLRTSKLLERVLITLDRDFIYYEQVSLDKHPGVIVISVGSSTPQSVNKVCEKMLKNITDDLVKNSLIKVTNDKIIKINKGKVILEKKI